MRIKVTRKDIDAGREDVGKNCGCPIWHALNRQLELGDDPQIGHIIKIPSIRYARIGRLKLRFPLKAVTWQTRGMDGDPLYPIQFDLGEITIARK